MITAVLEAKAKGAEARTEKPAKQAGADLDFEIQVGDGPAALRLRPGRFFGWLDVEALDLKIPEICFPLEVTRGIKQFQGHRCAVLRATFSVEIKQLARAVAARASLLRAAGLESVRVRASGDDLVLVARARVGDSVAPMTARLRLESDRGDLLVRVLSARVYGRLRRPSLLLAHDLLCVLFGATTRAATTAETDGEEGVSVVGLGRLRVRPLRLFLWSKLPGAGWRLPDSGTVALTAPELSGGRVTLRYLSPGDVGDATKGGEPAADGLLGDGPLLDGRLDSAIAAYRIELREAADPRPVLDRLLAALSARDGLLAEAERLAADALARFTDLTPAHLALAAAALLRGETQKAVRELERASEIEATLGRREEAAQAALAAARAIERLDAGRAADLYSRAIELDEAESEALDAVVDGQAALRRWAPLVTLLERQIERTTGASVERAHALLCLAGVCREGLGDGGRARRLLEQAVEAWEGDPDAWMALGLLRLEAGEHPGALAAFAQVGELSRRAGDALGETRAHHEAARALLAAGELEEAEGECSAAVEHSPDDAAVWETAAAIAVRRERPDEAVTALDRILALVGSDSAPAARARRERIALLLRAGRLEDVRGALRDWPAGDRAGIDERIFVDLAALEQQHGNRDQALEAYALAAARAEGPRAAEIGLRMGEILEALGRTEERRSALERAHAAAPGSREGHEAARILATLARDAGDLVTEARWVEALLGNEGGPERAGLLVRLAELRLATGEPDTAVPLLDQAMASGGRRRDVQLLQARAYGAAGERALEIATLEELAAADAGRDDPEVLVALAQAHTHSGDRRRALEVAARANHLAPLDPGVRRALADAAFAAQAWDQVITSHRSLLQSLTPDERAECCRRLALALDRQGQPAEAAETYRKILDDTHAAGATRDAAWRSLADLEERAGGYRQAAETLAAAAADARDELSAEARADLLCRAALLLHRRVGAPHEAVALLTQALDRAPAHPPSLDALDDLYAERGDHARVAGVLRRKLELLPLSDVQRMTLLERLAETAHSLLGDAALAREAHERLVALAQKTGDTAAVERHLLAVLRLTPEGSQETVLVQLEDLYRAAGRSQDLADVLALRADTAANAGARKALDLQRIELLLEGCGDREAARDACVAALERFPDDPDLASLLARIGRGGAPPDPAAVIGSGAVPAPGDTVFHICGASLPPLPPDLVSMLGAVGGREGPAGIIRALDAALARSTFDDMPRALLLHRQLGELHYQQGALASARMHLERVVADAPSDLAALARLADVYLAEGRGHQAAETVAALAALVPAPDRRAELFYRLGEIVLAVAGDFEQAAEAYLKGVDLAPAHPGILRRLVDYHWMRGEDRGVVDLASDVAAAATQRAVIEPATWARVAVSAALVDERVWDERAVRALAGAGTTDLRRALDEARARGTVPEATLERARRRLVQLAGGSSRA